MTLKVKDIKTNIVGKPLHSKDNSKIGREIEKMLNDEGWNVQTGAGPDILYAGIEIKSRNVNATSNQTVCRMTLNDIITTPYQLSPVYAKIQKQIRVYHDGKTVLRVTLYDFSDKLIQTFIEQSYESARAKLQNGFENAWVTGGKWGNFEKDTGKNTYQFRLTPYAYKKLERMSKDTFNTFFSLETLDTVIK